MTEETSVLLTKKEVAQCLSCSVRWDVWFSFVHQTFRSASGSASA